VRALPRDGGRGGAKKNEVAFFQLVLFLGFLYWFLFPDSKIGWFYSFDSKTFLFVSVPIQIYLLVGSGTIVRNSLGSVVVDTVGTSL
jgi:hypothetical protein